MVKPKIDSWTVAGPGVAQDPERFNDVRPQSLTTKVSKRSYKIPGAPGTKKTMENPQNLLQLGVRCKNGLPKCWKTLLGRWRNSSEMISAGCFFLCTEVQEWCRVSTLLRYTLPDVCFTFLPLQNSGPIRPAFLLGLQEISWKTKHVSRTPSWNRPLEGIHLENNECFTKKRRMGWNIIHNLYIMFYHQI